MFVVVSVCATNLVAAVSAVLIAVIAIRVVASVVGAFPRLLPFHHCDRHHHVSHHFLLNPGSYYFLVDCLSVAYSRPHGGSGTILSTCARHGPDTYLRYQHNYGDSYLVRLLDHDRFDRFNLCHYHSNLLDSNVLLCYHYSHFYRFLDDGCNHSSACS
jgi:hypothetical protein